MVEDLKFEIDNIRFNKQNEFALPNASRDRAAAHLLSLDYPTTREEAWKYTRLAKLKNITFESKAIQLDAIEKFIIPNLTGSVLVFVNGFFQENASTLVAESGVSIGTLKNADAWTTEYVDTLLPLEGEFFHALNSYSCTDGVAIRIEKGIACNQHIQILNISTGEQTYAATRNVIVCEDSASAHISMSYFSENASQSFLNVATEVVVGANSQLTIDKIQLENESSFCIATEQVKQGKDSTFTINTITLDGGLVRNNLNILVEGQNAATNLSGAYILRGKQHVDNHTMVDHKVAHCISNELYKGVMDENSTAVFNGKVFVRKDAQKINAFQSNGNVLLSDNATINSKPELEIYADDVKCSHGSTTGQLDEEAVFYLRARGISEKSARALMVSAFIGEVLEKIENESIRQFVDQKLLEKFGWEM